MSNQAIGNLIILALCLLYPLVFTPMYCLSYDQTEIQVEEKTLAAGSGSKYLVYTEGGVYENTDSWTFWKWDSSDLHGELKEGNCYHIEHAGWRVPFMSWYKNILGANEIECN